MTAINVIIGDEAAHVITDGAAVNPNGLLMMLASKVHIYPHIKSVVAMRGMKTLTPSFADSISSFGQNYDEIKKSIGNNLRRLVDLGGPALSKMCGPHAAQFDAVVTGWSDVANRPEAFVITTHGEHPEIKTAYEPVTIAGYVIAPTSRELIDEFDPSIRAYANIAELPGGGVRDKQLARIARSIIERQRDLCVPIAGCEESQRVVGGFAQLTTVTRSNITSRILARYDDKIGEKLGSASSPKIRRERPSSEWMAEQASKAGHLRA